MSLERRLPTRAAASPAPPPEAAAVEAVARSGAERVGRGGDESAGKSDGDGGAGGRRGGERLGGGSGGGDGWKCVGASQSTARSINADGRAASEAAVPSDLSWM